MIASYIREAILIGCYAVFCFFFFFQAEDGIRDLTVTGVQTCALPISTCPPAGRRRSRAARRRSKRRSFSWRAVSSSTPQSRPRSEERRVGKECRSRGAPYH